MTGFVAKQDPQKTRQYLHIIRHRWGLSVNPWQALAILRDVPVHGLSIHCFAFLHYQGFAYK